VIDICKCSHATQLAEEAGFPTGVYNTVTCSKDEVASVGRELAVSEKVAALSFTGSTAVGKVEVFNLIIVIMILKSRLYRFMHCF
jgi:acyl-CoA reductase-like NAD-dependent aldehyde dehydrogenase